MYNIRKHSTRSIQFQPKLLIDGDLVPAVKTCDSFRYLGRYFDFHMSNATHKSELCDILTSTVTKVDFLPLHPKNKIALYNRYLLSKLSWHFTVASLPKTWVCEYLENVVAQYICYWLDLPISATLRNIALPQNKFDVNIQPPFIKFIQCQTILRYAFKNSLYLPVPILQSKDLQSFKCSTIQHRFDSIIKNNSLFENR